MKHIIPDVIELLGVVVLFSGACAAWAVYEKVRRARNRGLNRVQLDYARKWWGR